MKATVIEDAIVLTPHKEHKNFVHSNSIIPKGTVVEGEVKQIKGKRRGKIFDFLLFKTHDNKFIYLNNTDMRNRVVKLSPFDGVKPTEIKLAMDGVAPEEIKLGMDGVAPEEIKLGFDGVTSVSVDETSHKPFFSKYSTIGLVSGAIIGYSVASHKNMSAVHVIVVTAAYAISGLLIGKGIEMSMPIIVSRK